MENKVTNLFQPIGPVARWRIIYEQLIESAEPGEIVHYDAAEELTGSPQQRIRSDILKALRHNHDEQKRGWRNIPQVGYMITEGLDDLPGVVNPQLRRVHRSSHRARRGVSNIDRNKLDDQQVKLVDEMERGISHENDLISASRRSIVRMERLLDIVRNGGTVDGA